MFFQSKKIFSLFLARRYHSIAEITKQWNENLDGRPGVDARQYHHFHDVSVLS